MTAMMAHSSISRWSGALGVCAVVAVIRPAHAEPRAVVELFTSQGCSSCPPADRIIGELAKDPDVIALSLPIDYWDYLGWKDTLADSRFSARQKAYSHMRGDRDVYTPQVVVNGRDLDRDFLTYADITGGDQHCRGNEHVHETAFLLGPSLRVGRCVCGGRDLPHDTGPLKAAILKMVSGQAHVALFTSALQIDHLLRVAQEIGLVPAVRRALNTELVVASVGPITSEALERQGISSDIVPGHPKLGHLVLAVARRAPALLGEKRERIRQLIPTLARVGQG